MREQYLWKPDKQQFQKMAFTEAEQAQFHEEWTYAKWKGGFVKQYVFNEPWRFVLKVRPNIIDKVRKQDPELDARMHQIKSYLERSGYDKVQDRLLNFSYKWWKWGAVPKYNEVNYVKNKPLEKILNELKE